MGPLRNPTGAYQHLYAALEENPSAEQRAEFIRRSQWSLDAEYVDGYVSGWGVDPNPYTSSATDEWDWGMTLDIAESDVMRYCNDPLHRAVGPP